MYNFDDPLQMLHNLVNSDNRFLEIVKLLWNDYILWKALYI